MYEKLPEPEVYEVHPDFAEDAWNKALKQQDLMQTTSPAFASMVKKNTRPAWLSHEPRN